MRMFSRNKNQNPPQELAVQPPPQSRVEIELHKNATEEASNKAQAVNTHLQELLEANGITIKIALAAGARLHHKSKGGN